MCAQRRRSPCASVLAAVVVHAAVRTQTIPQVPFLTQFTAAPISLLLADPVAAANFDLFIQDRMVRRCEV